MKLTQITVYNATPAEIIPYTLYFYSIRPLLKKRDREKISDHLMFYFWVNIHPYTYISGLYFGGVRQDFKMIIIIKISERHIR